MWRNVNTILWENNGEWVSNKSNKCNANCKWLSCCAWLCDRLFKELNTTSPPINWLHLFHTNLKSYCQRFTIDLPLLHRFCHTSVLDEKEATSSRYGIRTCSNHRSSSAFYTAGLNRTLGTLGSMVAISSGSLGNEHLPEECQKPQHAAQRNSDGSFFGFLNWAKPTSTS